MFAGVFADVGVPAGVFQVLPGGADVGEALATEPAVRVIAFTGSTRAGRVVGALAGQHLKRAHLELGGNSALIVLGDVREQVALGPLIDATQRDRVHDLVTASVAGGATLRTGGARGPVLPADGARRRPGGHPGHQQEITGPVTPFSSLDEVAELAAGTEYGLSLGILTGDVYAGLQLAERIPAGWCTSTTSR